MEKTNKIAFYPCCNTDFLEPYTALENYFDTFIFCDPNKSLIKRFNEVSDRLPKACLWSMALDKAIPRLHHIDILFYRRDSVGQGGSCVFVLGDQYFRHIAPKFSSEGGIIISDGSNARGKNWKGMNRKNGIGKYDRRFIPHPTLDFSELNGYKAVKTIQVLPA